MILKETKIMKKIIVEKNNSDLITWYEDNEIEVIAPCYYGLLQIYKIVKKYTDKKLIVNNIINNVM